MSHKPGRRTPVSAPTNIECPLASLGRNGLIDDLDDIEEDANAEAQRNCAMPDIYQLSNNLTTHPFDQALPVQQKAATFELRGGRQCGVANGLLNGKCSSMSLNSGCRAATLATAASQHQRSYLAFEHLLQHGLNERTQSGYLLHGNNADEEDSSDAAVGVGGGSGVCVKQQGKGHSNSHTNMRRHHQGGRSSVPTVQSSNSKNSQYYLGKKIDTLFLNNTMRNLALNSDSSHHFQNDRFYMEDGLRNMCDCNNVNERLQDTHILHQRTSSPSETSGSDRYLLNRTSSPANAFTPTNLEKFSTTNNSSSSSNMQLDKRYHHTKVKSLSDGLCNIGRFSPNLDQGYATLVSPSPTGHHPPNAITTHTIVHHPPPPPSIMTANNRRHTEIGPPPWNKKGPCRSGPYFDRLPDEGVLKIFKWLDSCELCNVARVCRRFEQLAWRPILWKFITLKGEHLNGDKALKTIFRQLCGQSRNGSCPDVERVILSDGCKISDKGLQMLTRRCPELTHLQMQMCPSITNQALMEVLTRCKNLQHLDVTGCTQVKTVSTNPNLEPPRRLLLQYLDLTDCMSIDDVALKVVVKNCPQLIYLYLRRCVLITDAGLKFVPSFCMALKELSVSDCINITDFGLYELAKLGAALRYLSVAKCDRVSDAGLKVIARRCYKLRYLNARGCEAVSDDSITVLAHSCPRLRALDIGKCDVSDAGLRALAENCPNLKKLSLRNCDMITDRGVQCIAYYCRGLQQLNIQDCQISIEGYRAVKKYCRRCIIEHTNPGFC